MRKAANRLHVGGTVLAQLSWSFVCKVRPPDARGNAAEEVLPHWICANRNSKTSTRLSTRSFHSPWSEPAPDLLAASLPALRSSRQCGGARIINSPDLPSRRGICLGRSPGEQNQFERSHPNG